MPDAAQLLQHALNSGCCLIYLNLNSAAITPSHSADRGEPKNIARRLLIHLLHCCTGNPITEQDFIRGIYGKPALPARFNIHFNLSHSSQGIAIALTRQGEVGIDIEDTVFEMRRGMDIAKRFYNAEEFAYLRQLETRQAKNMLQLIWTLKEAWIKATGRGLSVPLNSFGFRFNADVGVSFFNENNAASDRRWLFASWQPQIQQHLSLCLAQHQQIQVFEATPFNKDEFIISTAQLNMIKKSTLYDIS